MCLDSEPLITFLMVVSLFLLIGSGAAFAASVRSSTRYWKRVYRNDDGRSGHKRAD